MHFRGVRHGTTRPTSSRFDDDPATRASVTCLVDDPLKACLSEATLNGLRLRNRLIKAATSEGKSPLGVPSDALIRFHERIGEGGVGMTTLAYCAVEADGRLDENVIYPHEGVRPQLERFVRTVKATGAAVSAQLVHAGSFTKNPALTNRRPLGPSRGINTLGLSRGLGRISAMTHAQIQARVAAFAEAAAFMKGVGFDALEIHFGHGYAISQFISPKTNKRTDEYGGTLDNRMRFGVEVLAAVRAAVGDTYPLLGKISMTDGVDGGVTYADSVEIAATLDAAGLDAIVCSGGTSSMNPMLLFRGDSIGPGLLQHEKSVGMRMALRIAGPRLFKHYPFEETYFLEHAQRIRDRVRCAVCYIGGANSADALGRVMAAGFDFVQLGRPLIYDPDFPRAVLQDSAHTSGCTHCNRCVGAIGSDGGLYCTERPGTFE